MSGDRKVPEAIAELREIDQWVGYSTNKIPVAPTGGPADSTDRATWGTLAEAKFIRKVQGLPGVGFVFSTEDPYVGIDLDNAVGPDGELHEWAAEIVGRFDSYTELSPSRTGVHIFVRGDIPRPGAKLDDPERGVKIECYKHSRYFTVTGQPLGGTSQAIEDRSDDLAAWFDETFGRVEFREMKTDGDVMWEAPPTEEWVPEALKYLDPNMGEWDWRKVGAALKAELGEAGFAYWDEWSSGSSKYPGQAATYKKWRSIDETQWSIATLAWMADQAGFMMPAARIVLPSHMEGGWEEWLQENEEGVAEPQGSDEGLSIKLYDLFDLMNDPSPYEPDLVGPGVLGAGDMMLVFGPPKSMKSMATLAMCMEFSMGREWMGMRPGRPLRTVFAQFEIKRDNLRKRVQLLSKHYGDLERLALKDKIWLTDRFTPRLSADFITEFARVTLEACKGELDLLVLDPLANIYSGDSENDNTQMTQFVRAVKVLRNHIDPHVAIVLVHHASKVRREDRELEPFNALRGASALRGAYDTGIYLDRVDEKSGKLMMFWELRNGPGFEPCELAFDDGRFVQLGYDEADAPRDQLGEDADDWRREFERILNAESVEGRYYTSNAFADHFAGGVLGGMDKIKREIKRLSTRGAVGWFRSVEGVDWLPEPHHRSQGYLCIPNMILLFQGGLYTVEPDRMRDPSSGRIVEVMEWPQD